MNMQSRFKISVIIPFYQSPHDLFEKCLHTLELQSMKDFEVIIVNNADPDEGAKDYLDQCAITFKGSARQVINYDSNNHLPGDGRNVGIKYALGDYITYVDVDDYVSSDLLQILYEIIDDRPYDMVISGYIGVDMSGNEVFRFPKLKNGETESPIQCYTAGLAGKLYRRDFLISNDIWMPTGCWMEDTSFLTNCFAHTDSIWFIPFFGYFNYCRSDSASRSEGFTKLDLSNSPVKYYIRLLQRTDEITVKIRQQYLYGSIIESFSSLCCLFDRNCIRSDRKRLNSVTSETIRRYVPNYVSVLNKWIVDSDPDFFKKIMMRGYIISVLTRTVNLYTDFIRFFVKRIKR